MKRKLLFDLLMALLLATLYKKNVISLTFHELAGLLLCLFVVVHVLLNKKWLAAVTKALSSRSLPARTRICYAVDVLLALDFLALLITGVGINKKLFPSCAFLGNKGIPFHMFSGALALILVGIHIGLHWNLIRAELSKKLGHPAIRVLATVALVCALGFGGYSLAKSSVPRWLSLPFVSGAQSGHQTAQKQESSSEQKIRQSDSSERSGRGSQPAEQNQQDAAQKQGRSHVQEPVSAKTLSLHLLRFLSILVLFSAIAAFADSLVRKKKARAAV